MLIFLGCSKNFRLIKKCFHVASVYLLLVPLTTNQVSVFQQGEFTSNHGGSIMPPQSKGAILAHCFAFAEVEQEFTKDKNNLPTITHYFKP